MNNFNKLSDNVCAYTLSFLVPGERIKSASVSKRFNENAVLNVNASHYWLLLGAHTHQDFKQRAYALKTIHSKLFNALLWSLRINTEGKLIELEAIAKVYKTQKSEEKLSYLSYSLGEKSTLSF